VESAYPDGHRTWSVTDTTDRTDAGDVSPGTHRGEYTSTFAYADGSTGPTSTEDGFVVREATDR